MKKIYIIILCLFVTAFSVKADEGMWPLTLLKQLESDMQAKGLKLTAEDIYSINQSCVKDGVLRLMRKGTNRMFCTGEIISNEGLFLSNHHCGYPAIQELSTPEDNILKNGFFAKDRASEKQANLNIGILNRVEEVTDMVLAGININDEETARAKAVLAAVAKTVEELTSRDGKKYLVEVIPFYNGNKFLAMYYEVFRDIRLVGAPPENVGKFGGETDNWMWPRHTCDFSMFRIYANTQNAPADYDANNKPFTPKHFFPISLKGTKPGDYAMILGYPGRTTRYTYSDGINYFSNIERPAHVKIRRAVLDIYEESMHPNPVIKLMYADKYASLSNYWKKFMGEVTGLTKLKLYERRKAAEDELAAWINSNQKQAIYGEMFSLYKNGWAMQKQYGMLQTYFGEVMGSSQPLAFASGYGGLQKILELKDTSRNRKLLKYKYTALENTKDQFLEFYNPIEQKILARVIQYLYEDIDHTQLPKEIKVLVEKSKKNYSKLAEMAFKKSIFTDQKRLEKFLKKPDLKLLLKDPVYIISNSLVKKITELKPVLDSLGFKISRANRLFQSALMEMNVGKTYSPDANGTMRLTYGTVENYEPRDAVIYKEYTTDKGVVDKYLPNDLEFDAPPALIELMKKHDFGQYADAEGNLHTCFLTTNDITGGNSGSPVINGNGELIGTAFDGNWESISSDFAFEPALQRTISLDIRYTLFILDKFAGAGYLLNEMKIVR